MTELERFGEALEAAGRACQNAGIGVIGSAQTLAATLFEPSFRSALPVPWDQFNRAAANRFRARAIRNSRNPERLRRLNRPAAEPQPHVPARIYFQAKRAPAFLRDLPLPWFAFNPAAAGYFRWRVGMYEIERETAAQIRRLDEHIASMLRLSS